MPSSASTTREAISISRRINSSDTEAISKQGIPIDFKILRFTATEPFTLPESPAIKTDTDLPILSRWRATTIPSPPLFPMPAITTTLSPYDVIEDANSAQAAPAFSISISDGMARSSIAFKSALAIS